MVQYTRILLHYVADSLFDLCPVICQIRNDGLNGVQLTETFYRVSAILDVFRPPLIAWIVQGGDRPLVSDADLDQVGSDLVGPLQRL